MDVLRRALDILEFVCFHSEGGADDIARTLGIPKSTVYRLLASLAQWGYLRRVSSNHYEVGPRLLMLHGAGERQNHLIQVARPHLRLLARETGLTAHLAVLDASRLGYMDTVVGEAGVSIRPSPDSPLHCTSLGKVLLAYLSDAEQDAILKDLRLEQRTPHTIVSIKALKSALAEVREQGYAEDVEEFELGLRCLGAPVRNGSGEVVASISLAGLAADYTPARRTARLDAVRAAARAISTQLGWQDPKA